MDADWTRLVLGAEVGLGIGALILVGWLGTRWLLRGRFGTLSWAHVALSVAIIGASTGAYAVFSYRIQPSSRAVDPATISPAAGPAAASQIAPSAGGAGATIPQPAGDPVLPPTQQAMASLPPRAQIDAGGVLLKFDPPQGYCLYPADLMAAVLAMHKQTNKDNVVHAAFGDCDQLKTRAESGARIRDFGLVMTPTATVGKSLNRASLDEFAREIVDPTQARESVNQRLHEAISRLDVQAFSSVGVLDRDDDAIYLAFLTKLRSGNETFTQAGVMALTIARSRMVSLYLYSDYVKTPRTTLQTLLTKSKASVAAFEGLNK